MNQYENLWPMDLTLFDGGAAVESDQAQTAAAGGEGSNIPSEQSSDAGSGQKMGFPQDGASSAEDAKARMERYKALVGGEFKDLFAADTQRIIDKRFKETKGLQETLAAQAPVLERVMGRYGVENGDLDGLMAALDAEDARRAQAEQEAQRLLAETARQAAEERERALIQNILARGARPAENGGGTQTGVTARLDPARMTAAQRDHIARRAAKGETITFR